MERTWIRESSFNKEKGVRRCCGGGGNWNFVCVFGGFWSQGEGRRIWLASPAHVIRPLLRVVLSFSVTSSLALDNWGQKYCQILGNKPSPSISIIFDRFTFKILKNQVSLLAMNSLYNGKGQWPAPMVRRKNIHTVCCEDNYFPKEKFKLFNSLFHSVYLVFSIRLISIAVPYLWDVCKEDKCCVVTHHEADILVASLGLFTFARIACLLQLWIKTSDLDYSIWAMPK